MGKNPLAPAVILLDYSCRGAGVAGQWRCWHLSQVDAGPVPAWCPPGGKEPTSLLSGVRNSSQYCSSPLLAGLLSVRLVMGSSLSFH